MRICTPWSPCRGGSDGHEHVTTNVKTDRGAGRDRAGFRQRRPGASRNASAELFRPPRPAGRAGGESLDGEALDREPAGPGADTVASTTISSWSTLNVEPGHWLVWANSSIRQGRRSRLQRGRGDVRAGTGAADRLADGGCGPNGAGFLGDWSRQRRANRSPAASSPSRTDASRPPTNRGGSRRSGSAGAAITRRSSSAPGGLGCASCL